MHSVWIANFEKKGDPVWHYFCLTCGKITTELAWTWSDLKLAANKAIPDSRTDNKDRLKGGSRMEAGDHLVVADDPKFCIFLADPHTLLPLTWNSTSASSFVVFSFYDLLSHTLPFTLSLSLIGLMERSSMEQQNELSQMWSVDCKVYSMPSLLTLLVNSYHPIVFSLWSAHCSKKALSKWFATSNNYKEENGFWKFG